MKDERAIAWFEIPAKDFDRAVKFYEKILKTKLECTDMGDLRMGFFPHDPEATGGAIIAGNDNKPSANGTMIYISAEGKLKDAIARVPEAGGSIVQNIMQLPNDWGHIAVIRDTEGNKVGLHASSV